MALYKTKIDALKDLQKLIWNWCKKNKDLTILEIGVDANFFSIKTINPKTKREMVISLDNDPLYKENVKK